MIQLGCSSYKGGFHPEFDMENGIIYPLKIINGTYLDSLA